MVVNLELIYSLKVGPEHKKLFSQFFTDHRIASFMVDWVLASGQKTLYDPAFGLGAFYLAAKNKGDVTFTASEIDPLAIQFARQNIVDGDVNIYLEDYLKSWGKTHTGIVCNPPYTRFQNFIGREYVQKLFYEKSGVKLSGYTNIASMFLLKSLSEMNGKGRLAYIMPLEFLNTGYGHIIKKKLIEKGMLRALINLECEKEAFPEVTTSVGIILLDSSSQSSFVDFHAVNNIDDLPLTLNSDPRHRVQIHRLQPNEKWLRYFQKGTVRYNTDLLYPINHYGHFSRGIATGSNEFFVLSPARIKEIGLFKNELVPCITKCSQINKQCFGVKDYDSLCQANGNVFLLNINGIPSASAEKYIRWGEANGFHQRFLTKNRNPWYRIETRKPSPILFSVFSREGYKVIRNTSDALNLTCYHGFQPNLFGISYIAHLFLYLLSDTGRKILSLNMRKYGDSLYKFEPNDLNNALAPAPEYFDLIPESTIEEAIEKVRLGETLPPSIQKAFAPLLKNAAA